MNDPTNPKNDKDECFTPSWIFDKLGILFDIDVAAPINAQTAVPAKKYFTSLDDGLEKEWEGTVWMNPPYSAPKQWVKKFLDHADGIALLPFAKSAWFMDVWNSDAVIVALPTNLKFVKDGEPKPIMFPVFLMALGEKGTLALTRIGGNLR